MSVDVETRRILSDIQSKIGTLDYKVMRGLATAGVPEPSGPRPGRLFFAMAMAAIHRLRNQHEQADGLLERATRAEQRAVAGPAMTTMVGWAAELVQSPVGGLLLSIAKQSGYASIATRTPLFSIDEMSKVTVGGEVAASWIAEGQPINAQSGSLASVTLQPRKLACLVSFTEEMLEDGVNVATSVGTLLSAGIASALDTTFFGTAAASASAPAGILNGISATTASTATPPSEAALADLKGLVAALTAPTDPVFVVAPARQTYLQALLPGALGLPIFASGSIPANRIICVDCGALVAAHGTTPRFASSREATLHMDTVAQPISATGSPNTIASPTRSTYQEDTVALRAILVVAWALRAGGVSFADVTAW
jgi:hypothetical protein